MATKLGDVFKCSVCGTTVKVIGTTGGGTGILVFCTKPMQL
ncbi:MAG: desulfoferrodoxin [bacterium]|nr:desulfoferrodoxin [bacterium]